MKQMVISRKIIKIKYLNVGATYKTNVGWLDKNHRCMSLHSSVVCEFPPWIEKQRFI